MVHRSFPALVRTVAVGGLLAASVSLAHAADWSPWRGIADGCQGKIQFRYQSAGKRGGYEVAFQNAYEQKVTVTLAIVGADDKGATQTTTATLTLDANASSVPQTVTYKTLTGLSIHDVKFTGTPPKPTAAGFYVPSGEIPQLEKALAAAQKAAKDADKQADSAAVEQAGVRSAAGTGRTQPSGDHDTISQAGPGNVIAGQSSVEQAQGNTQKAHDRVAALEKQLTAARAADVAAQADAEKRAVAANAVGGASSGTTSPAVVTAITTGTAVPSAAPGTPLVPSATAKVPTLTGDQMKSLYKQAGDATKKKDWPTVETSLRSLLDGSGELIKPEDRADLNYRLGTAYDNDNKNAEAEAAYQQAIDGGIKDDALYNELATVQYSEGKLPEAEKSVRAAIEKKSSDSSYFFNLGLICMAEKKYKDAETAFRSALRLDPDNEQIKQQIKTAQDAQKSGGA